MTQGQPREVVGPIPSGTARRPAGSLLSSIGSLWTASGFLQAKIIPASLCKRRHCRVGCCFKCFTEIDFRPVILAGGSGTRFWPRSRRAHAKQVLALDGERSMIQQTVERLKPLASLKKTWVITNEFLAQEIADQLPGLPAAQIVQEPVARNTAPACGLAAFLIERDNPAGRIGRFSLRPRHRRRAALPEGSAKGHRRGRGRREHRGAGHRALPR